VLNSIVTAISTAMNETLPPSVSSSPPVVSSWKKPALIITGIVLTCCLLTAVGTVWWVKRNLYASPLHPVELSLTEQSALNDKLAQLELAEEVVPPPSAPENKDPRTLFLTAKEINAFMADQGIGEQVKIDLSRNRIAANFLLPIDENAPLFAGTTLRIRLAISALMSETGKLVIKVDDISLGGIPLPNAWLGDIKGLDLVSGEIGNDPAVQRFVSGIKDFRLENGQVQIVLNE
jgi:hypothetical protein